MNEVNGINGVKVHLVNWFTIYCNQIECRLGPRMHDKFITLLEAASKTHNYDSDVTHIIIRMLSVGAVINMPDHCRMVQRLNKLRSDTSICSSLLLVKLRRSGFYYIDSDTAYALMSHKSCESKLLEQCGWTSAATLHRDPECKFYFDIVFDIYSDYIVGKFWWFWLKKELFRRKYRQLAIMIAHRSDMQQMNDDESIAFFIHALGLYSFDNPQSLRMGWAAVYIAEVLKILIARGFNVFKVIGGIRIIDILRNCRHDCLRNCVAAFFIDKHCRSSRRLPLLMFSISKLNL